MGIEAEMAERDDPREEIVGSSFGGSSPNYGISIGLITIGKGPIECINIRRYVWEGSGIGGTIQYADYLVPDPRITLDSHDIDIPINLKQSDRNTKLQEKTAASDQDHFLLSVRDRLFAQESLRTIMRTYYSDTHHTIHLKAQTGHWIMTIEFLTPPDLDLWRGYESIAQYLLDLPLEPEQS